MSIHQINSTSIYQYVWSWTITKDFSLKFGYSIDPLTYIMSILITMIGIMVLIYSDNLYVWWSRIFEIFSLYEFFNTSMLRLVSRSNLIQIYIFWGLVGMRLYLVGFWFRWPINAWQYSSKNEKQIFGLILNESTTDFGTM